MVIFEHINPLIKALGEDYFNKPTRNVLCSRREFKDFLKLMEHEEFLKKYLEDGEVIVLVLNSFDCYDDLLKNDKKEIKRRLNVVLKDQDRLFKRIIKRNGFKEDNFEKFLFHLFVKE